jgi:hypothetical protein
MLIVSYVRLGRQTWNLSRRAKYLQLAASSGPSVPDSIRPDQRATSPNDAIIGAVFEAARATGIDDTSRIRDS